MLLKFSALVFELTQVAVPLIVMLVRSVGCSCSCGPVEALLMLATLSGVAAPKGLSSACEKVLRPVHDKVPGMILKSPNASRKPNGCVGKTLLPYLTSARSELTW